MKKKVNELKNDVLVWRLETIWDEIQQKEPMVHCMTHAITMNDSANAILAVGASPIMASHPDEVEDIVAHADSLVVNLGNCTEERLCAMKKASQKAHSLHIPILIDVVGIGVSTLRLDFAKEIIETCHPGIIKGNSSEIRRLLGMPCHAKGVDASREDYVSLEKAHAVSTFFQQQAARLHSVLVVTGPVDIISSGTETYGIRNGTPAMGHITGTGCMVGAIIGAYHGAGSSMDAALIGTIHMGLAGEEAAKNSNGYGTFHVHLLDAIGNMTKEKIVKQMDVLIEP